MSIGMKKDKKEERIQLVVSAVSKVEKGDKYRLK